MEQCIFNSPWALRSAKRLETYYDSPLLVTESTYGRTFVAGVLSASAIPGALQVPGDRREVTWGYADVTAQNFKNFPTLVFFCPLALFGHYCYENLTKLCKHLHWALAGLWLVNAGLPYWFAPPFFLFFPRHSRLLLFFMKLYNRQILEYTHGWKFETCSIQEWQLAKFHSFL